MGATLLKTLLNTLEITVAYMDLDGDMKLFATGQCEDVVDVGGAQPLFASRHFKLDSRVVETLLVIPL